MDKLINECIRIYFHFIYRAVFCFGGVILRVLYNIRMAAGSSGPNASRLKSSDTPNNCKKLHRVWLWTASQLDLNFIRYSVLKQVFLPGKIRKSGWTELSYVPWVELSTSLNARTESWVGIFQRKITSLDKWWIDAFWPKYVQVIDLFFTQYSSTLVEWNAEISQRVLYDKDLGLYL